MSKVEQKEGTLDYAEYMRGLKLRGIFLATGHIEIHRECLPQSREATIGVKVKNDVELHADDEFLIGQVSYSVASKAEGNRKPYAKVSAVFDVVFEGSREVPEELQEKFGHNVTFLSWPYLREFIDSMAARSSVPIPVIPLRVD